MTKHIAEQQGVHQIKNDEAGMVVFKTASYEEAEALCKLEPLVAEGYATYTLTALQVADKENNYLL